MDSTLDLHNSNKDSYVASNKSVWSLFAILLTMTTIIVVQTWPRFRTANTCSNKNKHECIGHFKGFSI